MVQTCLAIARLSSGSSPNSPFKLLVVLPLRELPVFCSTDHVSHRPGDRSSQAAAPVPVPPCLMRSYGGTPMDLASTEGIATDALVGK